MKPISSTELPPLTLKIDGGTATARYIPPGNKIGWVHSIADKEGASFDLVVRDALGREVLRKLNCSTQTKEFGELMNIDTRMGEELELSLENVKGADQIVLFMN